MTGIMLIMLVIICSPKVVKCKDYTQATEGQDGQSVKFRTVCLKITPNYTKF